MFNPTFIRLYNCKLVAASNKVSNPRQPPPETSNMFIEVLQRRPEIMQQLLATVSASYLCLRTYFKPIRLFNRDKTRY